MGTGLIIVWVIAALAIAGLAGALALVYERISLPALPALPRGRAKKPETFEPVTETLLFTYAEEGVRSAFEDRLIVHIPGIAWDTGWKQDLLRLQVRSRDPLSVFLPPEWSDAEILAAYELVAYRMTDAGTDIEVHRFLAPVDVVLAIEKLDPGLRIVTHTGSAWALAPPPRTSIEELEGTDLPSGRKWIAASLTRLEQVCLIRLLEGDEGRGTDDG